MAKLVKYILIPVFFVFVMSHNASAVSTVIDMNSYDVQSFYPYFKINCLFTDLNNNNLSNLTNQDECRTPVTLNTVKLRRLYSTNTYPVQKNDVIEFYVLVRSDITLTTSVVGISPGVVSTGSNLYFLMDYQEVASNVFTRRNTDSSGNTSNVLNYYSVYRFTFKVISSGNWNIGFISPDDYFYMRDYSSLYFSLYNLSIYRPKGESEINKEQREAAEDAAADSQTSGSGSQNDATSATSSLISVITSGIGAITSASASNCVINADMGNFDMGSIDLCANPVPTFMQVIGSIIAALVVLPLVIVLFNRFIAIIGSFQR